MRKIFVLLTCFAVFGLSAPAQTSQEICYAVDSTDYATTCGGACGGVRVPNWTCAANESCKLNCATSPPTTGCLKTGGYENQ